MADRNYYTKFEFEDGCNFNFWVGFGTGMFTAAATIGLLLWKFG